VNGDSGIFAALFELHRGVSGQGEVESQLVDGTPVQQQLLLRLKTPNFSNQFSETRN